MSPNTDISALPATSRLVAEVDLQHSPGDATLRFLSQAGGRRTLLRIQDLYNICQQIRRGDNGDWCDADVRLFRQLWTDVNKPYLLKTNLQVLKIPLQRFNQMVDRWEDTPDRFIERSSQKPYLTTYPRAVVRFELHNRGNQTKLSATVSTNSGPDVSYRSLSAAGALPDGKVVVHDVVHELDSPVPMATLRAIFGDDDPVIPINSVAQHLPALVNHRLDRLTGPSVRQIVERASPVLELQMDGADISIGLKIGTMRVDILATSKGTFGAVKQNGVWFDVVQYDCPGLAAVLSALRRLPLARHATDRFRLAGASENVAALQRLCASLNETLRVEPAPDFQGIFADPTPLAPSVAIAVGSGWLDVKIVCQQGETVVSRDELLEACRTNREFIRTRHGRWVRLNTAEWSRLQSALAAIDLDIGANRIPATAVHQLATVLKRIPDLRIHQSAQQRIDEILQSTERPTPELAALLRSKLRQYQWEGATFLYQRTTCGLGSMLADDMGLGKTVQFLSYLSMCHQSAGGGINSLVLCPASVVPVWLRECAVYTPELRVQALSGSAEKRKRIVQRSETWDLVVATYATARSDYLWLREFRFHTIVVDEAQQIKNPDSMVSLAVKSLNAQRRIALTGTPLENRTLDLWSIVDFLNPGYLGTQEQFKNEFCASTIGRQRLVKRVTPCMLRRTKNEVIKELPPRTVETLSITLTDEQQGLYAAALQRARQTLNTDSAIHLFAAITRLRQICCHPALVRSTAGDQQRRSEHLLAIPNAQESAAGAASYIEPIAANTVDPSASAKLDFLLERVDELISAGHSILIFSQFTRMLSIIENQLTAIGFRTFTITGQTSIRERQMRVQQFQEEPVPSVFLLSLKAAGTGLTLTKASYVFMFDPWWNPAVEMQAIDRVHRIGQDKPVFAYRLVSANTIEESVTKMQEDKRLLFDQVIGGVDTVARRAVREELIQLLREGGERNF